MYEVNNGTEEALRRYLSARTWSLIGQTWASVTRRPRTLLDLEHVTRTHMPSQQRYAGVRAVPIKHICGSEGRSNEFDGAFRPRTSLTESRWIGIAMAYLNGVELPPVDLIQIGDDYFVRDGHHRISVLRALGQTDIDAQVTVWQVAEPVVEAGTTNVSPHSRWLLAYVEQLFQHMGHGRRSSSTTPLRQS